MFSRSRPSAQDFDRSVVSLVDSLVTRYGTAAHAVSSAAMVNPQLRSEQRRVLTEATRRLAIRPSA